MGIVLEMPKRTAKLTGISLQNARLLPVRARRQAHKKQEQFYLPLFLL